MKNLIFDCGGVLVWPRMGEWNIPMRKLQQEDEADETPDT